MTNRSGAEKDVVKEADFYVLRGAQMPAVLVEMGFLSNASQEKLITGDAFQTTFVQVVYDAIVKFRDTHPGGVLR